MCPEAWVFCMSVCGSLAGDENMNQVLSNLIMCICLGRGVFEFRDPGPCLKGTRHCAMGQLEKGTRNRNLGEQKI